MGETPPKPEIKSLIVHEDDRGSLFEVLRNHELPPDQLYPRIGESVRFAPRFGQVYVVRSPARGTIRAFHRHKILWDYFCCVSGRARVLVVYGEIRNAWAGKNPREMQTETLGPRFVGEAEHSWTFVLSGDQPRLLTIPPGLFHGWEALVDDTALLCIGSEVYDRDHPDEERVSHLAFGDMWGIKAR